MISSRIVEGADLFWNSLTSLSLQTVELISMVREVMALRFVVPLHDMLVHHDLRDRFSKEK
jgi:hypothetical protein